MVLVVSKNQKLSAKLEEMIQSLGEESSTVMPGFSFVNHFLELEVDDIVGIIFDEDSMNRTISLLENSGELGLIKSINLLKVVDSTSDNYIYSTVNAIEIEEDALSEQLPVLLNSFIG